jgi:hypothetical protein
MARPMPRVEPVITATFPFMSNKVIRFSFDDCCNVVIDGVRYASLVALEGSAPEG